jgi:hypothetical protein
VLGLPTMYKPYANASSCLVVRALPMAFDQMNESEVLTMDCAFEIWLKVRPLCGVRFKSSMFRVKLDVLSRRSYVTFMSV